MLLKNTDILMKKKLADNDFDSYGILVSANGEDAFIHSDNVDLDTYFDIASMGKVLITAQLILKAVDRGWLTIDERAARKEKNNCKTNADSHIGDNKNIYSARDCRPRARRDCTIYFSRAACVRTRLRTNIFLQCLYSARIYCGKAV